MTRAPAARIQSSVPYTPKQLARNEAILSQGEEIKVDLVTWEKKRAPGVVRLLRMDEVQRRKRAVKFLLTAMGLSVVALLCPPHGLWFLVANAIGVGGYLMRGKQKERLLGGRASCPECGALQLIDPEPAEFPFLHFCSECRTRCEVVRAQSSSAAGASYRPSAQSNIESVTSSA